MVGPSIKITVDDAKLRELIRDTRGKSPVRIVADGVEYGLFQEMGVQNGFGRGIQIPAHPFMRPAVERVRPGFAQAFKNAITLELAEKAVEKAARDVEHIAKTLAPWDTRALINSIHVVNPGGSSFVYEVPQ